ncbi:MAG: 3-deoxy-7-phosphoheptulonate synthase [Sulfobacillus benefaciens]|uniref:3-deoxy-7-phosphoheptulonate synthase n=1 Tax=Sulfobacillus benefaciens TaxID=453960 RepID=A0A2T2WRK0_9FIRM|nr:MAG: 3-deoxy-7-phosphoheptulonate synthase [Sulfobacillus benefaciens]
MSSVAPSERRPYKLVSREFHPDDSIIRVGSVEFGGPRVVVIAGPCAVESQTQLLQVASSVHEVGGLVLRGGAYKPRTSPYSFQGLGMEGLRILHQARQQLGLMVVTEAVDQESLQLVAEWADMVQIGARNMQNFSLLKAVGSTKKPVLLKRGVAATIDEWLMAAEYIAAHGNPHIVLCERGIRTYEGKTRNTLDLSAIPVVKQLSHLPIIVDPSHATGHWSWVAPMARAGIAAGADGLIVEVHPNPQEALSDGPQSLTLPHFRELIESLKAVAHAVGRQV